MDFSKLRLNVLVLFLFLSALPMSQAIVSVQAPQQNSSEITKATLEEHLGRKLTFSEKIAFKIFNRKIKKAAKANKKRAVDCGKIVLKSGEILEVDILQISPTEVKYKRCNKPEDPEFIVDKKDIFSIQNAAGEVLYSSKDEPQEKQVQAAQSNTEIYTDDRMRPAQAVASLVLGILSLVVSFSIFGLICGILAVIFGAMAKKKIRENPDTYRGRKMAGAGLVLGIIACAIYALAAASIFTFI